MRHFHFISYVVVAFFVLGLSTFNAIAQSDSVKVKAPLPLVVSFGTHALSFPLVQQAADISL